jgi:hypothetical protein
MKDAFKFLASPLLAATGLLNKKGKAPTAVPAPVDNAARRQAQADDELMRRRGGAADIISGAGGAEAPAGGKAALGS